MAGDLNAGKLKSVLHVKYATRERETLDNLYSTHRDAYKALPRPPFGKSDHNYILLIPVNKQKPNSVNKNQSLASSISASMMSSPQ